MQLALENMTKTTVCLPSQQISHFWEYRLLPQHPDNGGGAQPRGSPSDFCPFRFLTTSPFRGTTLCAHFTVEKGEIRRAHCLSESTGPINGRAKCQLQSPFLEVSALVPPPPPPVTPFPWLLPTPASGSTPTSPTPSPGLTQPLPLPRGSHLLETAPLLPPPPEVRSRAAQACPWPQRLQLQGLEGSWLLFRQTSPGLPHSGREFSLRPTGLSLGTPRSGNRYL